MSLGEMILRGPFKETAGIAAVYEIRLRMLADMRPSTRHVMFKHAEDVEDLLIDEYKVGGAEAERLRTTRRLRNKILHGAFREAKQKLAELGTIVPSANVRAVDLTGVPVDATAFEAAMGSAKAIAEAGGSDSIYGWLLECNASGFFPRAIEAFEASLIILDRLRDIASEDEP